jgi:hypothetical protein
MIRISSIGLSFVRLSAIRAERRLGRFPSGPIEPAVERRPSQGIEDVNYRSGGTHRLAMGDSTMSIYTHRERAISLSFIGDPAERRGDGLA